MAEWQTAVKETALFPVLEELWVFVKQRNKKKLTGLVKSLKIKPMFNKQTDG